MSTTVLSSTNIVDELLETKRIRLQSAPQQLLKIGETRTANLAWVRNGQTGRWHFRVDVAEAGYQLIPSTPPLYVDEKAGEIGRLKFKDVPLAKELVAEHRGFADEDLPEIRDALAATGSNAKLLPPDIKIVDGGLVAPQVSTLLAFVPSSQRYSEDRAYQGDTTGRYGLAFSFHYKGQGTSEVAASQFSVWDGVTKTVYTCDRAQEALVGRTLSEAFKAPVIEGSTVWIGVGDPRSPGSLQRMSEAQTKLASMCVEHGWTLVLDERWPTRAVRPLDFRAETGSLQKGWLDFELTATVDGRRIDMLEILLKFAEDPEVLASLADPKKQDTVWKFKIDNGYWVTLGVTELAGLLPLVKALNIDERSGRRRISRFDVGALQSAGEALNTQFDTGEGIVDLARSFSSASHEVAPATAKQLRRPAWRSQQIAAGWCAARRARGVGAVIADEYAVGKTLQAILSMHDAKHEPEGTGRPSLAVVTKTLFFAGRWQADMDSFIPTMSRSEIKSGHYVPRLVDERGSDIVLTTYDIIKRYPEQFCAVDWNVVAFDEAHTLGNEKTNLYKAAVALRARQKLAITGSPMQNRPQEMWALMNLVVPGLLRDRAWFNRCFPKLHSIPATTDAPSDADEVRRRAAACNRARLVCLGKMIGPFQLRRTNQEIGRVLPSINEVRRDVPLPSWQATVYEGIRAAKKAAVLQIVATEGLDKGKFNILNQLTTMRQAACEPRLVKGIDSKHFTKKSGKAVAIEELCLELTADGKRVVLVSQWTEWLHLLKEGLGEVGITCAELTGEVKSGKRRSEEIAAFRGDRVQVLLLQLSFGEGFDLPEGDAVIICDPWWNKKKVEQAIARVRRDEREKTIQVIHLVAPDSVEEGVIRIAQDKLDDVDAVNEGGALGARSLTKEDVEAFFSIARSEGDEADEG